MSDEKDVFIAYSRDDAEVVEKIVVSLEACGVRVWQDITAIAGDEEWKKKVEEAIRSVGFVLALWSKQSVGAEWVKYEAITAKAYGKVLSATLDGSPPPTEFKERNAFDLSAFETAQRGEKRFDALVAKLISKRPAEGRPMSKLLPLAATVLAVAALVVGAAALFKPAPSSSLASTVLDGWPTSILCDYDGGGGPIVFQIVHYSPEDNHVIYRMPGGGRTGLHDMAFDLNSGDFIGARGDALNSTIANCVGADRGSGGSINAIIGDQRGFSSVIVPATR